MKTFGTLAAGIGALAFIFVAAAPAPADAGWRGKAWRQGTVPRTSTYLGPRLGYYAPRRKYCRRGCGYPYAYYPYWRGRVFRGWR